MKDRAIRQAPRRRRSWYRRRSRIRRIAAAAILVTAIAAVCALNFLRILSAPPRGSHGQHGPSDFLALRSYLNEDLSLTPPHGVQHPRYVARIPGVYPYSVVPGGVRDPGALRAAAARDRAVARHFSQFDFEHARLERLGQAREVYVSYRIRDTVFWTRKKLRLPAGELLLTDGKIAARAKCGNQISDTAKPEISDEEPDNDVLDQAVALEPLGPSFPIRQTASLPDLPVGQAMAQFGTGVITFPAPITAGRYIVCVKKNGTIDKNCGGPKGPPTPEPGTMVLLGSGLALIVWRYRMRGTPA